MTEQAQFGVVGLGVMGANLALNVEEKGFSVAVFNRSREKTEEFLSENPNKKIVPAYDYETFVHSLARPRRILIMVKAGKPVDATIESLLPYLSAGDVLVDGGNEFFENTEARLRRISHQGIHLVGMGVSGGEEGARYGPSMMPGGPREAYARIEDVVTRVAAQVEDGPCVTYIGPGGSGHYVKMVHNGIEYGDMQLISETYDLLKHVGGLTNAELADVFADWNRGELESFLIEITEKIFRRKDDEGDGDLIDAIMDRAKMKGTGGWTVEEGARLPAPVPTIASAVDARVMSALIDLRHLGSAQLRGPRPAPLGGDKQTLVDDARAALYAAKMCSYTQGLGLLRTVSDAREWQLPLQEIARIWKAGCIIRAKFLGWIQAAYAKNPALTNLLHDAEFASAIASRQDGWRRTIKRAIDAGIATPGLSSALAYYDALRRRRVPANLIQAQRDFFGAHTYERLDRPGTFHTAWEPSERA